jgi:hypothetical protein
LDLFQKWAILQTLSFSSLYGSELVVLDVINGDSCIFAPRCIALWAVASQEISQLLWRRALRDLQATLLSAWRRSSYGHGSQWVEMVLRWEPILSRLLVCKAEQPKGSLREKCSRRHLIDFKMTRAPSHCGAEPPTSLSATDESDVRNASPPCGSQQGLVA